MKRKCQRCKRDYPVYGPFLFAQKYTCLPCLKALSRGPVATSLAERTAQVCSALTPKEREVLEMRFTAAVVRDALSPRKKP